jgi:hypothetical protein
MKKMPECKKILELPIDFLTFSGNFCEDTFAFSSLQKVPNEVDLCVS